MPLFQSQPVSHPPDASARFRAEQPGIRRFERNTPDNCRKQIDCGWSMALLFEKDPVSETGFGLLQAGKRQEVSDSAADRYTLRLY